ncbi:mitochondrial carrier protein [Grosmannia clavigera kw1407]|uniref:Mitochondrial carrier protein n=1 Tax=Grosmannia clavigera (strain kw1407 / UAMH 11150) TaxID=655863 RepID=F0XN95_GROCL|nr:mitochondrial carrier protein [Grosmannia clavigera kw1407]EFX00966.1 mitochondrial carrier protein [Grosmannia clavigera kw1407]
MADEAGILDELNHEGSALQTAKDLFAGAAGGVAQVLLGQPFDIIKVRLQTSTAYAGAGEAAAAIWRHEGPLAFYKGTLTPLLGIGACVSVQFGAFHQARRWFEARAQQARGRPELTYGEYYAAGAFAGLANAGLSGPIEHVRIRLQTQPHGGQRLYAGPADCVRQLVAQSGGGLQGVGRGLFRGQAVTLWREAQAYGVWFLTFEWLMNADATRNEIARKEVPAYKVAFYGGLAGEALWLASYPFDVVKSKMQTDALAPADQRFRSMRDCFAQIWRADGFRGFWRGLTPTLMRAMPVSAGTFAVVEATMRAIN